MCTRAHTHTHTHTHTCAWATTHPSPFPMASPALVLLLKGAPPSSGCLSPPLHVIFICLIKTNLIKAGMAEMCKSSSEHRSWPDPKRGSLSPQPQAAASWAVGSLGEPAEEPRPRRGLFWDKLL